MYSGGRFKVHNFVEGSMHALMQPGHCNPKPFFFVEEHQMVHSVRYLMPLYCAFYRDLKAVIVTLDEFGHLYCSYLGTDPALFVVPHVDSRDVNYEVSMII